MIVGRFTSLVSIAVLVAALFMPQQAAGGHIAGTRESDTTGSWTEFRGNLNNTGFSTSTVPATNETFLTYATGWPIYSSAVVSTDILYFGSNDYNVYAVNLATGSKLWNYTTGSDVQASPLVVGDTLYVGDMDRSLFALNRLNGSRRWFFTANSSIVSSAKYYDGSIIFASQDGKVYFVNATTGLEAYPPYSAGDQIWGTPAVVDGTVIVGSNDGNVSRVRISDGFVMWKYPLPASPHLVTTSSAAVSAGRVFIGSDDKSAYALDLESGALEWRFQTGNYVYATPGVHAGRVFVHSGDGELYAVPFDDPNHDGLITANEILWQFHTGDGTDGAGTPGEGGSSPAIADGKVLVGSRTGYVYCLDEVTGAEVWSYHSESAIRRSFSSPSIVDGRVFIGLSDGTMYGFGASAPGMSVTIFPALTVIEGQRAMEIIFNVTAGGFPVEGAFVSFAVTAGTLSQGGASTLADGQQKVKYLAPGVTGNTTVKITAEATKYGMAKASAFTYITIVPAQDYGTTSGTAFSLDNYSLLLAVIAVLVVANVAIYAAVVLKVRRRSRT
jgi:outer membrane protein assembly factor BamB